MSKISKLQNKDVYFILIALGLAFWLVISIILFVRKSNEIETRAIALELIETTQYNKNTVEYTLNEFLTDLRQRTLTILNFGEYDSGTEQRYFGNLVRSQFAYLNIVFLDGLAITSDGSKNHITDKNVLRKLQTGEEFITDIYLDEKLNEPVIALYVPIMNREKKFEAYLSAVVTTAELTSIYDSLLFTNHGEYHITDGDGNHINSETFNNPFFSNYTFNPDGTLVYSSLEGERDTEQRIEERTYGEDRKLIRYTMDNTPIYLHFMPLDINNWTIITIIPASVVDVKASQHRINAIVLLTSVSLILIIVFSFLYFSKKKEDQTMHLVGESLRILANHTGTIILEWDTRSNLIKMHSDFNSILDSSLYDTPVQNASLIESVVHDDDKIALYEIIAQLEKSDTVPNVRIRIRHKQGHYIWTEVSHVVARDKSGNKQKTFIFIEDVDSEVNASNELLQRAQTDALTGLFNKATTENLIISSLRDPRNHPAALFIIDLDNFKDINDNFGHQYGDKVLQDVANKISSSFRSHDIVGRIGGDEFFVFMMHIHSIAQIEIKAKDLVEQLDLTYRNNDDAINISASVGIALTDTCGTDFNSLYNSADTSLYEVKKASKNGFKICNAEIFSRMR